MLGTIYSGIVFMGVLLLAKEYNSALFAKPLVSASPTPFPLHLLRFDNIYTNSAMPTLSPVPRPIPDSRAPIATISYITKPVSTTLLVPQPKVSRPLVPVHVVKDSMDDDELLEYLLSHPIGGPRDIVVYEVSDEKLRFYKAVTIIQIYVSFICIIIIILRNYAFAARA